jgi:hypothetical protein
METSAWNAMMVSISEAMESVENVHWEIILVLLAMIQIVL